MASFGPYADRTATALFSQDELWLLQASIRHEMPQHDQWRIPPASAELNDQIAESILRCEELGLGEAALLLAWDDCLAIDYCVPQAAKSASGMPVGKSVLLKSYRARKAIREGVQLSAEEPAATSNADVRERLRHINGG